MTFSNVFISLLGRKVRIKNKHKCNVNSSVCTFNLANALSVIPT